MLFDLNFGMDYFLAQVDFSGDTEMVCLQKEVVKSPELWFRNYLKKT